MTDERPILSHRELVLVTKKTQRKAQQRVLTEMGVHSKLVDRDLKVSRAHFEAVMAGRPTVTDAANEPGEEEYHEAVDAIALRRLAHGKKTRGSGSIPSAA
jgi:hypothetical protein